MYTEPDELLPNTLTSSPGEFLSLRDDEQNIFDWQTGTYDVSGRTLALANCFTSLQIVFRKLNHGFAENNQVTKPLGQ